MCGRLLWVKSFSFDDSGAEAVMCPAFWCGAWPLAQMGFADWQPNKDAAL
jgi:hypothetical protein